MGEGGGGVLPLMTFVVQCPIVTVRVEVLLVKLGSVVELATLARFDTVPRLPFINS